MSYIKPFEELEFYDDFMFGLVMQDKELCRKVLECLLGIKIKEISFPEPQKVFEPFYSSHGIRLDVYVQGENTVYDVELQNKNESNIGKRSRYYRGMMDIDQLLKGQDYSNLKKSVIIFLCRFDPLNKGNSCYTFKYKCDENKKVDLKDSSVVKVFNCTAYENEKNEALQKFLRFVQTGTPESDLTREIENMVEQQKTIEANKGLYFYMSIHDQDKIIEGRKEGILIGEKRGMDANKIANARNFLAMKVLTYEQIAKGVGLPIEKIEELAREMEAANMPTTPATE